MKWVVIGTALATGLGIALQALRARFTTPRVAEGALYSVLAEDGYSIVKVLKTNDRGVHLRLFSNALAERPTAVDETTLYLRGIDRQPGEKLGMGHVPVSWGSFAGWGAMYVQDSPVREEELEGYRVWSDAEGGYF